MKKHVYFLRHGQSELNAARIRQGPEGPLSKHGREQAKLAARRLRDREIEIIITSPFERARQTADIVAGAIDVPVEESELFTERLHPSETIGKPVNDPESLSILAEVNRNFGPGWRFSDEENFDDLYVRCRDALEFCAKRSEQAVLVVTHETCIRFLVGYMLGGAQTSPQLFSSIFYTFKLKNTGIVYCTYDVAAEHPWRLHVWNDYAHLEHK